MNCTQLMHILCYPFQAEKKNKDMQELNRFLHYYSRFKNHGHSHKLEEPLMKKAPSKMKKLSCHTAQMSGGELVFIVLLV